MDLGTYVQGRSSGELVWAIDPSIVFIAKTWADEARLKQIKKDIQFNYLFFVPRVNIKGGLAMLWKNSINLSIESFSKNHIDSIIDKGSNEAWRFTGFYGEPNTQKRKESWDLLCWLNRHFDLP